ncbi:hypothetical protein BO70DRAFT_147850 [Aspergillus heteromorphus CBS 117.55]|uniref:Uncharacterized protein n=1 Tax=Aspergillus heteromorphus CBS 117.55 TaxID=1448321 RepID=A0A317V939_9EURO|nr:uncharacterized protein BO70DRAFT_147850 [Aspergillus heteromorphus CBS 117.55]PWY69548.1 hypothetical protein BO70DRAFT_147850 [Aspergillus heteromorphus CBS 117.55]
MGVTFYLLLWFWWRTRLKKKKRKEKKKKLPFGDNASTMLVHRPGCQDTRIPRQDLNKGRRYRSGQSRPCSGQQESRPHIHEKCQAASREPLNKLTRPNAGHVYCRVAIIHR